jgi:Rieske 2Fe-2S family protein
MRETLTGHEYRSPEVFDAERLRIFHRHWFYAGRSELVAGPEDRLVVDVAGESMLVVRDRAGALHAHHNVCRHRGAALCDESGQGPKGGITCPYHAWSYALDGRLIGTPHVDRDEFDREALSLWSAHAAEWEGFVFVSLATEPPPLPEWLAGQEHNALQFARYRLGSLRIGRRTVSEVAANWKVLIENYNECLHCPKVHPELVEVIPHYRTGSVIDPDRDDGGVFLAAGATSFTMTGRSMLPLLANMSEVEARSYFGAVVFPNMFIDITGTSAIATTLLPRGPAQTTVVSEYLFRPEAVADPGFDPTDVVEFSELVAAQDYDVCERVQRGVSSRAFTHGVYAEKDSMAWEVMQRYRREMGADQ